MISARLEAARAKAGPGAVLSAINVAYDQGRAGSGMLDVNEVIWAVAAGGQRPLVDVTYDYDSWFPRIQELIAEASMAAKGYPAEALDWYAELGAGQRVRVRTPWGVSPGVIRGIGYPQGSLSTPWRSKAPQDPLLRLLEETPGGFEVQARAEAQPEGGSVIRPTARAYSDDTRMWAAGWAGAAPLLRTVSYAAPRLGIGIKPTKVRARASAAAGPEPAEGLWVTSWNEAAGAAERIRIPVEPSDRRLELLGVPKAAAGEKLAYAHKVKGRVLNKLRTVEAKRMEWDEVRAAVAGGVLGLIQYAPVHARMEHEDSKQLDDRIVAAVRAGMGGRVSLTPYGMFTEEAAGGLGIRSMVVERVAAVARELLVSLNQPGEEGDLVRHAWAAGREAEDSDYRWAEEFLAGYGIFVRDAGERTLSRFLDALAEGDHDRRQPLVGPGRAASRARLARWRSGGAIAEAARGVWRQHSQAERETEEPWAAVAPLVRLRGDGPAAAAEAAAARRLAAAARAARERREEDWRGMEATAGLPPAGAAPGEDWTDEEDPWVPILDDVREVEDRL